MTTQTSENEHPIIFNGWSVRRILAGEKTQTRRVVKPQPPEPTQTVEIGHTDQLVFRKGGGGSFHSQQECPYGQTGSRLWVREAFRLPDYADEMSPSEYVAGRDFKGAAKFEADGTTTYEVHGHQTAPSHTWGRKRPSIHMPRDLCRLRLRVEDVRVERVQEITGKDARAEGCIPDSRSDGAARLAFAHKWDEIHGDGAWGGNPWVWVVEFSPVE